MSLVLFALGAIVLLTVVSGVYVFIVACVRRKDLPWLVEEEIKKTPYGKYYDYIIGSDRWLKERNAKDVYIRSDDGLRLHGLWIPAKNAIGTVLFAHGYRSTMLVDFGLAFDFYHNKGMNLLVPEQRCHGQSEGRFITFGVKESRDMVNWLDFHNANLGKYPVILSGLSMGASTMLYLADQTLPDNVKGIVADCGFTSPKGILTSVFTRVTHLPAYPSLWVTELISRMIAGFSLSEKDTRKILPHSRLPVFLIHGTGDQFVPCQMTREAYSCCAEPKKLLLAEGADHGVSFIKEKERYTQMISDFINQYILEKY